MIDGHAKTQQGLQRMAITEGDRAVDHAQASIVDLLSQG